MTEEFTIDGFEGSFKRAEEVSHVQMTLGDILYSLEHSGRFFIQFFLPEELDLPIPDFHIESWELLTMEHVQNVALALPRGHAKTTLMKLVCLWHFLFTPKRFIIYVSNTAAIAAEACKDIANYIRSANFRSVFGTVIFETEQDQRGFYKFRLYLPDAAGNIKEKYCILRAIGAGQQVRGLNIDNTRPELACVDDLEDDDNTATALLQRKLIVWFYGPFLKALSRKNPKIIYAGNMLSNTGLLYYFCVKSTVWYSIRYSCLRADGTPLWADMWSLLAIRNDYQEYQQQGLVARWFAEMMNMPMAEGLGLIKGSEIPYVEPIEPGQQEMAFITLDPAVSKTTYANNSALVVHVYLNGIWRIAEHVEGKYTPDILFHFIIAMCQKWNTRAVGIEAAGYQTVLEFVFKLLMTIHNDHFNVCMVPHKNRSKTERLIAWCAVLRKRIWALQIGDMAITEQLLAYDPGKVNNVDDLIDSCSMGVTMTELYMPMIVQTFEVDPAQYKPRLGYEACAN